MGVLRGSVFNRLSPVSKDYATLPIEQAFDWGACAPDIDVGDWYLVGFRSIRRPDADESRLTAMDDQAHLEAAGAPGFVHYFKGPTNDRGECLSFCLWDSRQQARAAAGLRAHADAVTIALEMYS